MAVVGVIDEIDLTAAVRRARADVVVVGEDPQGEQSDLYLKLLRRHPHIKVLAIAESGKKASFYELRPRRISIGKISARSFAASRAARAAERAEITAVLKGDALKRLIESDGELKQQVADATKALKREEADQAEEVLARTSKAALAKITELRKRAG